MIRAPFKRKPNITDGAGGGGGGIGANKKSPCNASSPASSRASLVNLNEDCVSLSGRYLTPSESLREWNGICTHSDDRKQSDNPHASSSNIYTEIDVCKELFTNDLIADTCTSNNDTDFLTADVLRRLFDESTESLTANVIHTTSACANYANDSMLFHMYTHLLSSSNPYNIDNDNGNSSHSGEQANDTKGIQHAKEQVNCSSKHNEMLVSIGKSLKHKFRMLSSDDANTLAVIEDGASTELNATTSSDHMNLAGGSSLTDRLKVLLRSLKLFKDSKVGGLFRLH